MYRKKRKPKYLNNKRKILALLIMATLLVFTNTLNQTSVSADEPTVPAVTTEQAGLTQGTGTTAVITNDASLTAPAETLPDIEIYIDVPDGYYSDKVTVTFRLQTKDGSMPEISQKHPP